MPMRRGRHIRTYIGMFAHKWRNNSSVFQSLYASCSSN
nr:unnamed protein product [Callosobruchus chinensis]